ncbi:4531_t:CDS:2 [Ambispora gerdemannii]|uniref:Guanine deaminase n=1 Tax=Ambispora gerdemannii TaxID=144530 RepID=A0A9N8VLT6_9GLOM|nr:4531_t:CDS:2 [Ambispora gerdemannii]
MSTHTEIAQIFHGTFIHPVSLDNLEIIENGLMGVDAHGRIAFVERGVIGDLKIREVLSKWKVVVNGEEKVRFLTMGQFLLPGFIDTHTHAAQYPNAGTGRDLPLLEWLKKYTFPLESSFSLLSYAQKIYPIVVDQLLLSGTTTAVYFATIHLESSKYLAQVAYERGQRAFVGKVSMDCNAPNCLIEVVEESIKETESFVQYVLGLDPNENNDYDGEYERRGTRLVTPVLTPRFAVSCTSKMLEALGKLAKKYDDIPIQSHLSENQEEVAFVKELFPHIENYTKVYDDHELLNDRSIMAHGIYLSESERALIKERNAGISHCPNSNFTILSGVCNVRQLLDDGIKVGLGTDISGGSAKSILNAVRNAGVASRVISMSSSNNDNEMRQQPLSLPELLYLATMGGARLLNLENVIGNFQVGKEFDALLVDTVTPVDPAPFKVFEGIDDSDVLRMFEKFMFLGDERNLRAVYVKGRMVSGVEFIRNNKSSTSNSDDDAIIMKKINEYKNSGRCPVCNDSKN